MPKYTVCLSQMMFKYVEVNAESEKTAMEKAKFENKKPDNNGWDDYSNSMSAEVIEENDNA